MELCLLNLLILIDWFLCNSYPYVLLRENAYSWNFGKIYLVHFLKFWNLPRFTWEISKFQKSERGKLSQISLLNMWLLVQTNNKLLIFEVLKFIFITLFIFIFVFLFKHLKYIKRHQKTYNVTLILTLF